MVREKNTSSERKNERIFNTKKSCKIPREWNEGSEGGRRWARSANGEIACGDGVSLLGGTVERRETGKEEPLELRPSVRASSKHSSSFAGGGRLICR